jgi:hypothetical protein
MPHDGDRVSLRSTRRFASGSQKAHFCDAGHTRTAVTADAGDTEARVAPLSAVELGRLAVPHDHRRFTGYRFGKQQSAVSVPASSPHSTPAGFGQIREPSFFVGLAHGVVCHLSTPLSIVGWIYVDPERLMASILDFHSRSRGRGSRAQAWILLLLLLCDIGQHRIPDVLLLVNERRGFGRRHWTGIAAEFGELLLQIRLRGDLAQVSTYFLDNGLWRVQRCPPGHPTRWLKNQESFPIR